jgi:hypothetical protein
MNRIYWIPGSIDGLRDEHQLHFFADALSRGQRPYRHPGDASYSWFGVTCDFGRDISFIFRGCRSFEVHLAENEDWIWLGPYFGVDECTCVVVKGYEAVRAVCYAWLGGEELQSVLRAATFYNRSDMTVLTPRV